MIDFEKGIVNRGNWTRVQRVLHRAAKGETIRIGFIGGSITQGARSSTPETCYAFLVYRWFQQQFPTSEYVNAGIGGTSSQFGVARVEDDVLRYHPDMVFVEFSVNDANIAHYQETYEGLIRKIYRTGTAVMLIHNVMYDSMTSAEDVHAAIGKYYDIPCVSMRSTIYPEVASGRIPNRQITPDDLHPNDEGHALVAKVITSFLDRIAESTDSEAEEKALPAALTANQYEKSILYQNTNANPVLRGFEIDPTPQEHITQIFRHGYTAWKTGDSISFEVSGTGIAVQYRKSIHKPAPIARVVVDSCEETAMLLDANFDEDWGDCLYLDTVLFHGENKMHHVEISIVEAHENDAVPFYLVSVIGSEGEQ